jgi:hypothetical protein
VNRDKHTGRGRGFFQPSARQTFGAAAEQARILAKYIARARECQESYLEQADA